MRQLTQILRQILAPISDSIFPPRESELRVRSLSEENLLRSYKPVLQTESIEIEALLPYTNPDVQACILETKFHGNTHAAELLGAVLRRYLYTLCNKKEIGEKVLIIPIPLSKIRHKERGYNQVERIVQNALQDWNGNTIYKLETDFLERVRDTQPQTSLGGAARRINLLNAFKTTHSCSPAHAYIVVDDVTTTGSTLFSAAQTLKNAGAKQVLAVSLAR